MVKRNCSRAIAQEIVDNGIKQGSLIGITTEQKIETIVGILAILKAGCAYVPLPDYYPEECLSTIIDIANIALVIGNVDTLQLKK